MSQPTVSDTLLGHSAGSGPHRTDHHPKVYSYNGDPVFYEQNYSLNVTTSGNIVHLTWDYPIFRGAPTAAYSALVGARLFIQRSTSATNNPLAPDYNAVVATGPLGTLIQGNPPVDANWVTIASFLEGTVFPIAYDDTVNFSQHTTNNYRIIMFINLAAEGVNELIEIDWNIATATTAPFGSFRWALTGVSQLLATVRNVAVASASGDIGFAGFMENFVNWGDAQRNSHGGFDAMYGKISSAGAIIRSAAIGSINSGESAQASIFDSSGNLWVFGHFCGTVDFSLGGSADISGHTLTSNATAPQTNIFLAAYDTASPPNLIALHRWGPTQGITANYLAIDSTDHLYLAVNAQGSTAFAPSTTIAAGSAIIKLDSSLNAVWGSTVGTDTSISALAVDTDGSVAITGSRFVGQNNAYLSKYDSSGGQIWDRLFTSSSAASASGFGVAIDPVTHKIIVCGIYGQGTDFGMTITDFFGAANGNPGDTRSLSGGSFIACYTSANSPVWARTPNVSGYNQGDETMFSVCIDSSQNVFFCGKCNGGIYLGNPDNQILLGGHATYCASVDLSANPRWGFRSSGSTGITLSVAIGQGGALILGGQVSNGTMNFDQKNPGTNGTVTTTSGVTAPFVASFTR